MAALMFVQADYARALDWATQAIAHAVPGSGPYDSPEVLGVRARIYVRLNDLVKAEADITQSLSLSTNNAMTYLAQAELAIARKQPDAALEALRQWETTAYYFGGGYLVRAHVYSSLNDVENARTNLAEATKNILFPNELKDAQDLAKKLATAP